VAPPVADTASDIRGAGGREPLLAEGGSTARQSAVVAGSFLLGTALGGLLGLLIGIILGESAATDSLLAAYSLYLVFALFGSNVRVALVPLIGVGGGDEALRARATDAIARLATVAVVVAVALVVLSPALGEALRTGDLETAIASLAILALASGLQIAAASQAAALAAGHRFVASAVLYVISSAASLAFATILMLAIGAVGAAIGVLVGSAVLYAGHVAYLRRRGVHAGVAPHALRERATWRMAGAAAGGSAVPLATQVMLTIALAGVSGEVGTVTAYSYGYFVALLLASVTAGAIGFTSMPGLVSDLSERGAEAALGYLRTFAALGALLYVPLAAAVATFGRPVLDRALAGPLTVETLDLMWDVLRIFLLMGLCWVLLTPVNTLALSLQKLHAFVVAAVVAVVAQLVVVVPLGRAVGPEAVAIAHAALAVGMILLVAAGVFGRDAPRACLSALVAALPAIALAVVFPLLELIAPDGWVAATGFSLLGIGAYLALALVLWPSVARPVLAALLRRP
jgi:O-antigen/teichoic acid export membrane protein